MVKLEDFVTTLDNKVCGYLVNYEYRKELHGIVYQKQSNFAVSIPFKELRKV